MKSSVVVYLIIGVMVLMPILYFGLRAAFKRKKDRKAFITRVVLTLALLVLAEAAVVGLYSYTVHNLPMLVMERTVRDAAAGRLEGQYYLTQDALIDVEGFDGAQWKGAMIALPKKVMEDEEGRQIYPARIQREDETACVVLIRLTEADGEPVVPARVESVEYIAPEELEERIGGRMTYFDTSPLN